MQTKFILAFLFICYGDVNASDGSIGINANDELNAQRSRRLLENVFAKADTSQNFLIAPYQMLKLMDPRNDRENAPTERNVEDELYLQYSPYVSNPISVVNTQSEQGLVSKVQLRSRWSFNFQTRDTHKRLFYTTPQQHVYTDSLRKDDIFNYTHIEELNATAVELPLQRDEVKLLILLPDSMDGLQRLTQQLSENVSFIDEIWEKRMRSTLVRIFLPKFHITYRANASEWITELTDSAENQTAEESKITQVSQIDVKEDGIGELAQRTVLFWNAQSSLRAAPRIIDVNHPFLFIVSDENGIQFLGYLTHISP